MFFVFVSLFSLFRFDKSTPERVCIDIKRKKGDTTQIEKVSNQIQMASASLTMRANSSGSGVAAASSLQTKLYASSSRRS